MRLQPFWILDRYSCTEELVYATSAEDALIEAGYGADEGYTAEALTPEQVAEVNCEARNEARRERYAERKKAGLIPSRAKPDQPELPWTMHFAALALDPTGRLRCARGHFTTADQLVDAPTGAAIPNGRIDFSPTCARCRAKD